MPNESEKDATGLAGASQEQRRVSQTMKEWRVLEGVAARISSPDGDWVLMADSEPALRALWNKTFGGNPRLKEAICEQSVIMSRKMFG